MAIEKFLIDGIAQLDAGINSGVDPHLLPPNQVAFATNATFRGAFIGPRPGVRKLDINFATDVMKQVFTKNRWQGGCFYQADDGSSSMVVAVGGRLYQITPNSQGLPVADIVERTIPGDPNPITPLQAWLWQSEKWVIWQDGGSVPVFFDGTTSRRSNSVQVVYGTTAANFTAPAKGALVTPAVTLTSNYTGPPNAVVLIGDALYQVTSAGATGFNANLTTVFLNAPITYPIGTQVLINPNVFGVQKTTVNFATAGTTYAANTLTLVLTLTQNYTGVVGTDITLFGIRFRVTTFTNNFVQVQNKQTFTLPATLPAGTIILLFNSNLPSTLVGSLFSPFVAPAVGVTATAALDQLYSGAAGQVVFIGSDQYTISPLPPPPPGTTVELINITDTVGTARNAPLDLFSIPELPPGRMGAYGHGQNWMSLTDGIQYIASDLVGSNSGTQSENYRDAVLRTIQSTSVGGLGNFRVPGTVGDIRAMSFVANLDVSLGQGPLMVFTPTSVFSVRAPLSVSDLANINSPIVAEALKGSGGSGQYDLALDNSDIIFGASDNGVRSLQLSRLDFDKWPNTPISREMDRVMILNDTTLLQWGSSVVFNNRFLKAILPTSSGLGVYHRGLIALNFDPLSSIRGKAPSVWDGFWTALNVLQLITGTFNGKIRCFAFCVNTTTVEIELWEILADSDISFDNDRVPITWSAESATLFNDPRIKGKFDLIELLDGEIYLRDIRGIVTVQTWYRPDYSECWIKWHEFSICAKNDALTDPKQFRTKLGLGEPDIKDCDPTNDRPYRIGTNFQFRFQITGTCKFMGAEFKAKRSLEPEFSRPICEPLCDTVETGPCEPCKEQGECVSFPLVFYSLGDGKIYSNPLQAFDVTCPDGSTRQVFIQPGTINYNFPYPVGFNGDYPPAVLPCLDGNIVRAIPPNASQTQIDEIINDMIETCARMTAQATAPCTEVVFNDQVFFTHDCGVAALKFVGSAPAWITFDSANSRLVGAAGTFSAPTLSEANALAQSAIDQFGTDALASGQLYCQASSPVIFVPDDVSGWTAADYADAFVQNSGVIYAIGGRPVAPFIGNFYSSTNGTAWTLLSTADLLGDEPAGLAFGVGLFATGSLGQGRIWTSPTGAVWTQHALAGDQFYDMIFANGLFVAVGNQVGAGRARWSVDGITWNGATIPFTGATKRALSVCYGLGVYMAAGHDEQIFSSPDAVTWTNVYTGGGADRFNSIAFINGLFIAVGTHRKLATSTDGINWTPLTAAAMNINEEIVAIAGNNTGYLVATANLGGIGRGYFSTDQGVTWTLLKTDSAGRDAITNSMLYSTIADVLIFGFTPP